MSRIAVERVTDVVYRALREAILNGELTPGGRLDVNDLADRLKVSRTPVAESLALLASQGLVEIQPRKGSFVKRITAREVAETFDVRGALEALAGEQLAATRTDADLVELDAALAAVNRVDASKTGDEHDVANAELHRLVVDLGRNGQLIRMYDGLQAHVQIARLHRSSVDWRLRAPQEAQEHAAIVSAIRAGDQAGAAAVIRAHIQRGKHSLLQDIERLTSAG
ncbi:MAG: GntR family transcriptional regulator [Candidatus Limnocylindria bacterium]